MTFYNVLLLFLGSVVILAFQNCGKAGFDSTSEDLLESSSTVDPQSKALPFPFQPEVNQIGYLSCPNSGDSGMLNSSDFTFRFGGFQNTGTPAEKLSTKDGGLRLTDEFVSQFKKLYDDEGEEIQRKKLEDLITNHPVYGKVQPLFSIRDKTKTRTVMFSRGTANQPIMAFTLGDLSEEPFRSKISDWLIKQMTPSSVTSTTLRSATSSGNSKTTPISYFAKSEHFSKSALYGSLAVPVDDTIDDQDQMQSDLRKQSINLGFVSSSSDRSLPQLVGDGEKAYGREFVFNFDVPQGRQMSGGQYPVRAMFSVQELDLMTRKPIQNANWVCPVVLQIVKPEDRRNLKWTLLPDPANPQRTIVGTSAACEPELYSEQNNATSRALLHMIRRFLPAESWDVNLKKGCAVPRTNSGLSCYRNVKTPIVYDEVFFANPVPVTNGPPQYAGCGIPGRFPCPHYFSLCVKQ